MLYKIIYNPKLLRYNEEAKTIYPFPYMCGVGIPKIILRSKFVNRGVIKHEITHALQYKKNKFHCFLLMFDELYLIECEIKAYINQYSIEKMLEFNTYSFIINNILDQYKLKISKKLVIQKFNEIIKSYYKV